jgi:hypothetical protein
MNLAHTETLEFRSPVRCCKFRGHPVARQNKGCLELEGDGWLKQEHSRNLCGWHALGTTGLVPKPV